MNYLLILMEQEMKKLLDLGFKKVPTEDGFHMYELTPAALQQVTGYKRQATSYKRQATSGLDKIK
jgi:hypothetical protein